MLKWKKAFLDDLQNNKGRSLNTLLSYERDLNLFEEFQKEKKSIEKIYLFLKKKKLSPRSQARTISVIRMYFRFCEKHGEKTHHFSQLSLPKVDSKLPYFVSEMDFEKLMDACRVKCPHKTHRNQVTLLLLFGLGCRASELIHLDIKDFNDMESCLKVKGKGDKERLVPLILSLKSELKKYILETRPVLAKEREAALLVNNKGHRLHRVDLWRWISQWAKRAGVESVSPHKFRHGCATTLLESGLDLRSIQTLLGHASIQTTQIYTQVTSQKLKSEVNKHHPIAYKKKLVGET